MAIQYYMRAFNTNLSQYVDWVVNDTPDSIGAFSGYPANQLINITVNRIVQSKVANFLKPNQSRGGTDGYFFHVNSYDWINATAPQTGTPLTFTGFAIERGINSVASISTASNGNPINVTTSTPHGLVTGQIVTIIGVNGNINANGTWPITVTGSFNFTLNGSVGSGTPVTNSGNVYTPKDMSTLIWDEVNQVWRFVFNTNGDGVTLGASQSLKINNSIIDGYIAIGPDPADVGAIRLSNNTYIFSEMNPPGADIQLIGGDAFNRIKIGNLSTDVTYIPGIIELDGYLEHTTAGIDGISVAQSGFIREQNNTTIVAFRTQSQAGDIAALSSNTLNNVILGDANNGGTIHNTATGNVHQFQVNSAPQFEIGAAFARFTNAVTLPTILQTAAAININGQTLTLQAQNAAPTGTGVGGNLNLTSGAGNASPTANGVVNLQTGGATRITLNDTTETYNIPNVTFATGVVTPLINQVLTAGATATGMTIQSQNSTNVAGVGGSLTLTSGSGSSTQNAGNLILQSGGLTQLIVTAFNYPAHSFPTTTGKVTITGNLEVQGTLTTVDSTTVDIVGAVIHGNWSDPGTSPNVGIPTTVVGYSSHRGNLTGVPRDGASLIWTEGATANNTSYGVTTPFPGNIFASDGYWRAISTPGDGFGVDTEVAGNALASLGVLANNFVASIDPNPFSGTLPGSGGLRSPNNVPVAVARNVSPTTTLVVSGTTPLTLPQGSLTVVSTTGFTSTGSLLVASSAGPQTVTYTGTSGGNTFTGVVGGTGTIVTGNVVAQTNATTTIAAGSNNTALPVGTINVTSTVGFPQSGTLRIITLGGPGTPGVPGNGGGIQTVTYTTVVGNSFQGCSGGTGYMYTGNAVQLAPITGTADIHLLSADFGNRILHGLAGLTNTGQIFNTSTGGVYDFWVNSISQIQLGNADIDADGYAETVQVSPTVSNPRIYQLVQPYTGANNGFNMLVQAQAGQLQTGGANNNNGGILTLASGAAGTGGGGTAGVAGVVTINVGSVNNSTFNNIDTEADGYAEWLAIGPTLVNPRLYQATLPGTGTSVGTNFKINAQAGQNVAAGTNNNGGNLVLASGTPGTGGTAGTPGQIEFFFGNTLELTLVDGSLQWSNLVTNAPTISQAGGVTTGQTMTMQAQNASATGGNLTLTSGSGATNGNVNVQTGGGTRVLVTTSFTAFNDSTAAEALRITPVSTGTTQITYASTDTAAQINQTTTGAATGATMTMQAQNAATTGGALTFTTGTGGTNPGNMIFQIGGTTLLTLFNTTGTPNTLQWLSTTTSPIFNQQTTGGASGQTLTVQAQNAATTGGNLALTSGTGTTAGNVNLQTGAATRVSVNPTFTSFLDTAEAFRITPVSAGTTQLTFAATDTAAQINQTQTASTPSANMTVQSQVTTAASGVGGTLSLIAGNATGTTSTGGALNLASGSGTTTNGVINFQPGGTTQILITATGQTIQWVSTVTAPTLNQATTGGASGQALTVQAQNAATTGGNLNLTSGTGGTTNGNVNLQVGGSTNASVTDSKFVLNKGWRRNVTQITGTYAVLSSDDYIAITTISAPFTITLPATPTLGDSFTFKDASGTAATNNVTISGNGNNIDGAATVVLTQNYSAVIVTFTGTTWSIS